MRKTGLLMLLAVCLLFSLQFAVACPVQAEDSFNLEAIVFENKIIASEEVTVKQYGEILTDYSVIPIQAVESDFNYYNNISLYGSADFIFISGVQNIGNKRILSGGDLLYAGFI